MADKTLNGASYTPEASVSKLSDNSEKQSSGVQKVKDFAIAGFMAVGLNFTSPYAAKAEEVAVKFENDALVCTASAAKDLASLDASIDDKSKNGFDPVKLEKIKAKRQELFEKNTQSCIETIAANRKAAQADAQIAQADAQIAQADAQIAQADAQIAQADAQIADSKEKQAQADARISQVAYIQNQRVKIDAVINVFDEFLKAGKTPGELKKLQDMIAQIPTFSKDARAYLIAMKPILMERDGGKEEYAQLDIKVRQIENSVTGAAYSNSNYTNIAYTTSQK